MSVLSYRPDEKAMSFRERISQVFAVHSMNRPEFGAAWKNLVMEPPRRELRVLLKAAIASGELVPGIDMDLALAQLLGPLMYWFVFLRIDKSDPKTVALGVVDAFWRAYAKR